VFAGKRSGRKSIRKKIFERHGDRPQITRANGIDGARLYG
jgi:hypothetical protein